MILPPKEMFMILNPRHALALPLLALTALAPAAEKPRIEVEEWTMSNGMKWLLYERQGVPDRALALVARLSRCRGKHLADS